MPAIALAISGCDDRQVISQVEHLLTRATRDADSAASLYYAYALSCMDKRHAPDHWRFILGRLGGEDGGRLANAAMEVFLMSLPDTAETVVAALKNDPDRAVRKGANEVAKALRMAGTGQGQRTNKNDKGPS